jgi:hypothetical protein
LRAGGGGESRARVAGMGVSMRHRCSVCHRVRGPATEKGNRVADVPRRALLCGTALRRRANARAPAWWAMNIGTRLPGRLVYKRPVRRVKSEFRESFTASDQPRYSSARVAGSSTRPCTSGFAYSV